MSEQVDPTALDAALVEFYNAAIQVLPALERTKDRILRCRENPESAELREIREELGSAEQTFLSLMKSHKETREGWNEVVHGRFSVWGGLTPAINAVIGRLEHPARYEDYPTGLDEAWRAVEQALEGVTEWATAVQSNIWQAGKSVGA